MKEDERRNLEAMRTRGVFSGKSGREERRKQRKETL